MGETERKGVPAATQDLMDFIEASPSPWHAVAEAERRLQAAGWARVEEGDASWPTEPGAKGYVVRGGGSVVAWRMGRKEPAEAGFRGIGAHTDSPNLRVKPRPDKNRAGYATLGVEVYGGAILATWTDRDLALAGRVSLRGEAAGGLGAGVASGARGLRVESRLLRVSRPLCRIPNLAIHLNRQVNSDGLKLNQQDHLPALWGMAEEGRSGGEGGNGGIGGDGASNAGGRGGTGKGSGEAGRFKSFVASELGVEPERVLGWDLCLYDVQAPCVSGAAGDFVHAARLDNLGSCHAGLAALLGGAGSGGEAGTAGADASSVVALFDHEEVGSRSTRGAESSFLRDVLQRLAGREPEALLRASARSFIVSADMAHGVHPNYADRHEPEHRPVLNGGPVLKTHVEWRYATDAETMAVFRGLCADLSVPLQDFVIRSDLACGTTIGPIVAANLGIRTVDVGNPMLSMHSCREMAGAQDAERMIRVMEAFLGWSGE